MNTTTRAAAAFTLSATFTIAMLASVGALFAAGPQTPAAELARAADTPTQVVVIEGKRIARS